MIKRIFIKIKKINLCFKARKYWKKNNKHNMLQLCKFKSLSSANLVLENRITSGKYTYGLLNFYSSGNETERIRIGNFCQISGQAHFLLGGEHKYQGITTYPFDELIYKDKISSFTKGEIVLEDEVWVGFNTTIMSGVHIGKGAIIGAGSVVVSDVPPYAIVGGVPAQVINYRFSKSIIDELKKTSINYEKIPMEKIELLRKKISDDNYLAIIRELEKY